MAFNAIYAIFRENTSLVDIYVLEMFVHALHSLQLNHGLDHEGMFLSASVAVRFK